MTPCFTRNLVVLTDNAGHTGVGEIHGGDYTCDCLNAVRPLVEGQPVARYREVLQKIHRIAKHADGDDGEGIQTLDISKLKFVVKSEWAIECAMLDLMGQFLGVPMCTLLGEGQQRKEVEMLAICSMSPTRTRCRQGRCSIWTRATARTLVPSPPSGDADP